MVELVVDDDPAADAATAGLESKRRSDAVNGSATLNLFRRSLEGRNVDVERLFVDPTFGILDKNGTAGRIADLSSEDTFSVEAEFLLENLSKKVLVDCSGKEL
jgi:hypothetical protein